MEESKYSESIVKVMEKLVEEKQHLENRLNYNPDDDDKSYSNLLDELSSIEYVIQNLKSVVTTLVAIGL